MNSDIPLETSAIFFLANLYIKQGIGLVYVMVDIICVGFLDLWGAQTENYYMTNSCLQWVSIQGPFAYEAKSLSVALLDHMHVSIDHLNGDHV